MKTNLLSGEIHQDFVHNFNVQGLFGYHFITKPINMNDNKQYADRPYKIDDFAQCP